jgi:hypothetical protein
MLLAAENVNEIEVPAELQPDKLARRLHVAVLLDVAVGCGSVEVTKYLLEFHEARPTHETLKMALSTGSLELIRLIWERLPESETAHRAGLLEVVADFHWDEPLAWLLRDANDVGREAFALERHLADGLVVGLENGLQLWRWRVLDAAGHWLLARRLTIDPSLAQLRGASGWSVDATRSAPWRSSGWIVGVERVHRARKYRDFVWRDGHPRPLLRGLLEFEARPHSPGSGEHRSGRIRPMFGAA